MIKLYIFDSVADALAFEHPAPATQPATKESPEIAGGDTPESPETDKPVRRYKKRKKGSTNRDFAEHLKAKAIKERIIKKAKAKKGTKICKNCGKPGHMAKTCPDRKPEEPELTQEQIDHIKDLAAEGKSIATIVMETGLPSKVVRENMY